MSRELFNAGSAWFGHLRGGLAVGSIAAAGDSRDQRLVGGHVRDDDKSRCRRCAAPAMSPALRPA